MNLETVSVARGRLVGFDSTEAGNQLLVLDPSAPGLLGGLPVEERGIPPRGIGAGAISAFALPGADTDGALP